MEIEKDKLRQILDLLENSSASTNTHVRDAILALDALVDETQSLAIYMARNPQGYDDYHRIICGSTSLFIRIEPMACFCGEAMIHAEPRGNEMLLNTVPYKSIYSPEGKEVDS